VRAAQRLNWREFSGLVVEGLRFRTLKEPRRKSDRAITGARATEKKESLDVPGESSDIK
jgi:hypothetical protein